MKNNTVIISGGGTGGHLYPALAVGEALKKQEPNLKILFVGGSRILEKQLMDHYQAEYIPLKISGLKGMGGRTFKSLLRLPPAFLKSAWILIKKRPGLVIGAGGYSSGPIVLLAAWKKIPTLIMEQNQRPGFTNRLLLKWVDQAVISFQSSLPEFQGKAVVTGNPVREEFYQIKARQRSKCLNLLIFGGSQGSHILNQTMVECLPLLKEYRNRLSIRHQCGEADFETVKAGYRENDFLKIETAPYFHKMAKYFQDADLIICRAGATSVAELIASARASILVPFARASEDHQTLNAREIVQAGGAEMIPEQDLNPEILAGRIIQFILDPSRATRMEEKISSLRRPRSAEKIARICLRLMNKNRGEDSG